MGSKFSRTFYRQDTETVARSLLGQTLVHQISKKKRLSGKIVEVEAYLGKRDAACHTYGGRRTPRTETMYLDGGYSYVYFIYGMHFCFNVVTGPINTPEAVLIRAVEPQEGQQWMLKNRNGREKDLTNGPAKLCQAFSIDRSSNGLDLKSDQLFIEKGEVIPPQEIGAAPRVGIDYAGEAKNWKLRYYLIGNSYVSRPKPIA